MLDNNPLIDPRSRLHPEAASFLDLLRYPDLLETQTAAEIRTMFKRAGYREDLNHGGGVTLGWGRKVGESDADTHANVLTRDGQVVQIFVGGKGLYAMNILVKDAAHPDRTLLQDLSLELNTFPGNQGSRLREWWGRMQHSHHIPNITLDTAVLNGDGTITHVPEHVIVSKKRSSLREKLASLFKWLA